VLNKVESSDWATPSVPVLMPDGTVSVCGDCKLNLKQYLDVPEYPMSTLEELFGEETKLHLMHTNRSNHSLMLQ